MKVSLDWIKEYVELPESMDLTKLAYDLTMSTVEVEGAEKLADKFDKMIVGIIKEVLPHPNADKLRICKTDIGNEIKDIVCGGSNLETGMKVAVACPGAMVKWHGEGELVEIKNAALRGVQSFGMICAAVEIGLADLFPANNDHEIVDLSAFNVKAGTPLAEALDLDDIILEIDNKSMTNRPDLWGHYGIAREIAALYDLPLKEFPKFDLTDVPALTLDIQDTERCPRYMGTEINGVYVKPAPYKIQQRIWKVGMRPINALVDITNYVMLATGNPTHAFDADNIKDHIVVRTANDGEKLLLLNGKDLTLSTNDLVIADTESAVGLAGVMGGAKDSILPKTQRVLLEVANFNAQSIRGTALRYDNRTDASSRYEKAIDPERCDQAFALSMQMFKELYPDMQVIAHSDFYPNKLVKNEIDVSMKWLESRLGKVIAREDIVKKLSELGFEVSFNEDNMHIVVPTWRSTGDISIKDDIMEEVARMYGYENFEPSPITTTFTGAINQLAIDLERKIKEYLAFRCNMREIFTYPWMDDEYVNAVLQNTDGILKISTPPSPDESYIRSSLLPNIVKAVNKNLRYYTDFSIFECAKVFFDKDYTSPYDETEKLPLQQKHFGGAFVGTYKNITNLFRKSKGVLENMSRYTHMEAFTFKKSDKPVWADETLWMNIFVNNEKIGDFALLSKQIALQCGIKSNAVMLFEFNYDVLKPFKSRTNTFSHLPEYPVNDFDLSMLIDENICWADIKATILAENKDNALLKSVSFVEEYKGKQIIKGKKSVTLRLEIGSDEKTLTSSELEKIGFGVAKCLEDKYNAMLRN